MYRTVHKEKYMTNAHTSRTIAAILVAAAILIACAAYMAATGSTLINQAHAGAMLSD